MKQTTWWNMDIIKKILFIQIWPTFNPDSFLPTWNSCSGYLKIKKKVLTSWTWWWSAGKHLLKKKIPTDWYLKVFSRRTKKAVHSRGLCKLQSFPFHLFICNPCTLCCASVDFYTFVWLPAGSACGRGSESVSGDEGECGAGLQRAWPLQLQPLSC